MSRLETFAELFEQTAKQIDVAPGSMIRATVVEVTPEHIVLNAGLKSDAIIAADEFKDEMPSEGDIVEVVVESLENGFGETRLSREKAKRAKVWYVLEDLHKANKTVLGTITERVKGGFTVDVQGLQAFLPGSLVDLKPVRDPGYLEGKELDFKIIKMDKGRNNIVVSRRAVMSEGTSAERQAKLEELTEGQEIAGVVKNITDYGAFIDLGGVDGLLHITDMAWKRINHPSDMLSVGDEVCVMILKFDREKNRVSLGIKQLGDDPWRDIEKRYPAGSRIFGKVTNVTDYGCFVEIEDGVEGLVHMSEMDWTNKNIHPGKIVKLGDEVEVMVLDINEERRRISLGIKQCKANPWEDFAKTHKTGEKVRGVIRSITDFGVFIGLEGEIDGLIHLSDLSWTHTGEESVRQYKKGDEIEAIILAMDPERERISLGIKQLEENPMAKFVEGLDRDAVLKAQVIGVEKNKATLQLADGIIAVMRIGEFSYD